MGHGRQTSMFWFWVSRPSFLMEITMVCCSRGQYDHNDLEGQTPFLLLISKVCCSRCQYNDNELEVQTSISAAIYKGFLLYAPIQ